MRKKNTHTHTNGAKQGALKNQLLKASMAFLPDTALVAREVTECRRNKWENQKITIVMPYNYEQSGRDYNRGHCCGWDWEWPPIESCVTYWVEYSSIFEWKLEEAETSGKFLSLCSLWVSISLYTSFPGSSRGAQFSPMSYSCHGCLTTVSKTVGPGELPECWWLGAAGLVRDKVEERLERLQSQKGEQGIIMVNTEPFPSRAPWTIPLLHNIQYANLMHDFILKAWTLCMKLTPRVT